FGQLPMLDLASKDMGFIEYYNLDIYIPLIIILLVLSYGMYRLARLVVTKLYFKIKNRKNTYHEVSKSE
uniref:ABC transporter permease n=1 Tax=Parastrongyloides trichosuri TaxID=131310 RepID=A0A0N5A4J4_PARTI